MRRSGELSPPPPANLGAAAAGPVSSDWTTLRRLFPYLWQYKWRVLAALAFMVAAKMANVGVPLLLKQLVDTMNPPGGMLAAALLVVPAALLLTYGLLRLSTTLFAELRDLVFSKATEGAARSISLQVFRHLHALSLRFHLERQTGGMTRDIERGTRAVHSLISYSLYSIIPTLIEVALVLTLLAVKFDVWFAWITVIALVFYISFTVAVTEWRTQFRKRMNELDSTAHSRAIDSLLNYETVKYFNNEEFEARRYDENLERYRRAAIKSQTTLSLLNAGQQLIIAVGLVAMLWRATQGVVDGRMTLGDLVMVNAFMIQLYIPLGFLGVLYREIMQALPHRALLAAENKALVGFSGGQGILWHKGHRRTRWPSAGIERLMQSPPAHHLLRHLLPDAGPRRQPGGLPIDATQTMRHGSVSPLRSGLSSAWPKAKDSGGVQASHCKVICPVLRGRR